MYEQRNGSQSRKSLAVVLGGGSNLEREGLKALLSGRGNVRVTGHAPSLEETLSLAQRTGTDTILLIDPADCLDALGREGSPRIQPGFKVLAIVGPADVPYLRRLLLAGISGLVAKDCHIAELVEALRTVSEGRVVIDAVFVEGLLRPSQENASSTLTPSDGWDRLTPREKQILSLLRDGFSNKEIARRLYLSVRTVEMHLYNSYSKLNVRSRLEAAFKA
ncbi:MAG: LuxR C-terminal-related transcriptional regulator [Chloroflexota bacterium]